jgi:hypothetical protein
LSKNRQPIPGQDSWNGGASTSKSKHGQLPGGQRRQSERQRYGERVSTGFVESAVNQLLAKRMVKRQQMQWTKKGAHLLVQARAKVLNEDWEDCFRQQYPCQRHPYRWPLNPTAPHFLMLSGRH